MSKLQDAGKGALVGGVAGAVLMPVLAYSDGYDWKTKVAAGIFTGAITGALGNLAYQHAREYSKPQYPLMVGGVGALGTGGALSVFRDAHAGPKVQLISYSLLGGVALGSIIAGILAYRNK